MHINIAEAKPGKGLNNLQNVTLYNYGTPEGTFLFQYLPVKKSKQKESERKSKQ